MTRPHTGTLLVAAALEEELQPVLKACEPCKQEPGPRSPAGRNTVGSQVRFLKTGVGSELAARKFKHALGDARPSSILITGYAGALEPTLRLGDLLLARRAILLSDNGCALETWKLVSPPSLWEQAASAGLRASWGDLATSRVPVLDPGKKSLLFAGLGAAAVDMETAVLARIAAEMHIPAACVRVITDEATDTFPSPLSSARHSSWWQERTVVARQNLLAFFTAFFRTGGFRQP